MTELGGRSWAGRGGKSTRLAGTKGGLFRGKGARAAPVLIALALLSLAGCGSDEEPPASQGQPVSSLSPPPLLGKPDAQYARGRGWHLKAVPWTVSGVPHGHRLPIVTQQGFCVGGGSPKLNGVHLVEAGRNVHITAYVEVAPPPAGDCLGYVSFQRGIVRLEQKAEETRIFDAMARSPALRWPRRTN